MMRSEKYFYQTLVILADKQGLTLQLLSSACGVKSDTLSKQLRRDGSDLTMFNAWTLREMVAPGLTLDELYPEAFAETED